MAFVPTPATAQIYWQITHGPSLDSNHYTFSALSGNGKFFTASARKTFGIDGLSFIFLRSNDGGMKWTEQDPSLPYHVSANHDEFSVLDQIDSADVVAGSKYGIILRTFDGGKTWEKQMAGDSLYPVSDIDFSDSLNGILTKGGYVHQVWTTSDGGRNWLPAPFKGLAYQCHTTGPGHYRLFGYGNGPLYTTDNDWGTIDTAYVSDSLMNLKKVLAFCDFGSNGLMFAYGSNWTSPGPRSLIARTSNDGETWQDTSISYFNNVLYMSDPDRDTIVAGGSTINYVLISTDSGLTWIKDSSIVGDSAQLDEPCGIFLTADEHIVAAFDDFPLLGNGYLVVGTISSSSVIGSKLSGNEINVYPDPASLGITITSFKAGNQVQVVDILGRTVLHGIVPAGGMLTLDVSTLLPGLYYVSDGISRAKFVKE